MKRIIPSHVTFFLHSYTSNIFYKWQDWYSETLKTSLPSSVWYVLCLQLCLFKIKKRGNKMVYNAQLSTTRFTYVIYYSTIIFYGGEKYIHFRENHACQLKKIVQYLILHLHPMWNCILINCTFQLSAAGTWRLALSSLTVYSFNSFIEVTLQYDKTNKPAYSYLWRNFHICVLDKNSLEMTFSFSKRLVQAMRLRYIIHMTDRNEIFQALYYSVVV